MASPPSHSRHVIVFQNTEKINPKISKISTFLEKIHGESYHPAVFTEFMLCRWLSLVQNAHIHEIIGSDQAGAFRNFPAKSLNSQQKKWRSLRCATGNIAITLRWLPWHPR
jgi:hypothetical protein